MTSRALRIGYTCHDAFPSTHTNTQQIFWTLSEVARLGHAVDLCVPAVSGGTGAAPLIARHYGAQGAQAPSALRFVPAGARDATSAFAKGRFDLRAPSRFSRATHDVVWTRDPLAMVAAVRTGLPAVFETYRPDLAAAPSFALWRRAALRGRSFAGVITHSTLAASAFVQAGVAPERVLVAHNGHAPSLMQPSLARDEARALAGLPADRPLVIYAGHVGAHKGTDALIALAAALPSILVAIVGVDVESSDGRWVQQRALDAGASNVVLLPRVHLSDVSVFLYAADCLVIPPTDAPLRRYGRTVLPMKVFSYMAAGRPILAPKLPDIEEVLVDGETARLVAPGDVAAAADALRALLDDREGAERMALRARAISRDYTWSARARKIAGWMQGIVD